MGDPDVVTAQLTAAGFADATFERIDGPVVVGDSVEQAVAFQLAIGPAGEVFREAGPVADARRDEIEQALWPNSSPATGKRTAASSCSSPAPGQ